MFQNITIAHVHRDLIAVSGRTHPTATIARCLAVFGQRLSDPFNKPLLRVVLKRICVPQLKQRVVDDAVGRVLVTDAAFDKFKIFSVHVETHPKIVNFFRSRQHFPHIGRITLVSDIDRVVIVGKPFVCSRFTIRRRGDFFPFAAVHPEALAAVVNDLQLIVKHFFVTLDRIRDVLLFVTQLLNG